MVRDKRMMVKGLVGVRHLEIGSNAILVYLGPTEISLIVVHEF